MYLDILEDWDLTTDSERIEGVTKAISASITWDFDALRFEIMPSISMSERSLTNSRDAHQARKTRPTRPITIGGTAKLDSSPPEPMNDANEGRDWALPEIALTSISCTSGEALLESKITCQVNGSRGPISPGTIEYEASYHSPPSILNSTLSTLPICPQE